jgi:hypothetical protein
VVSACAARRRQKKALEVDKEEGAAFSCATDLQQFTLFCLRLLVFEIKYARGFRSKFKLPFE